MYYWYIPKKDKDKYFVLFHSSVGKELGDSYRKNILGIKNQVIQQIGVFGIYEGNFELIWSISIVIMCHDVSLCTNVIIWILYGYKELQNGTSVDPVPVSLSPLGPLYELFSKSLCQDRMMDWIRSLSGN